MNALELAVVHFLESYCRFLAAWEARNAPAPPVSPLFFALAAIQRIELRKLHIYASLQPNRPPFHGDDATMERRVFLAVQALKKHVIQIKAGTESMLCLHEIAQYYAKKRRLFPQPDAKPPRPWLNPSPFQRKS